MIKLAIGLKPETPKIPCSMTKNQYAIIMPIGDVHYGIDAFPRDLFIKYLQWGMERGAWFLGMGEYLDFTSQSQRAILQTLRDSTRKNLDDMVRQLADEYIEMISFTKGRWLGILRGDHTHIFLNGRNVDQYIAQKLETKYLGFNAHLCIYPKNIKDENAATYIYAHHGVGTSRTIGGQFTRLEDIANGFRDLDIVMMGHCHSKGTIPLDRQCLTRNGIHYHRTIYFVRTGSWLRGYVSHEPFNTDAPAILSEPSYIEQRAYKPAALGGIVIFLGYTQVENTKIYKPENRVLD
jgi:hypothetical protein